MSALIQCTPVMTYADAKLITGGLARTSKMPCPSWGIPASYCKTGQKLRKLARTSCNVCYAMRGFINGFARQAYERRYQNRNHPQWVEAMVWLISDTVSIRTPYFRWFCSGDLQDVTMLSNIIEVCQALPQISFWLPTQERGLIHSWVKERGALPTNLTVRLSSPAPIDQKPKPTTTPQSYVVTESPTCPASSQHNKCEECRDCWDASIGAVSYMEH
ncbi:MAG: GP88 family protein [Cellvibrionaceae bacterium]